MKEKEWIKYGSVAIQVKYIRYFSIMVHYNAETEETTHSLVAFLDGGNRSDETDEVTIGCFKESLQAKQLLDKIADGTYTVRPKH